MGWISPTGFTDDGGTWSAEPNIYDGNTATKAEEQIPAESWGNFVELTLDAAKDCNKIQFYAEYSEYHITQIDVDVYKNGAWEDVYAGIYTHLTWVEKTFTQGSVTKARVRFYSEDKYAPYYAYFHEFQFWVLPVAHEVTITEKLGILESVSKPANFKRTITESLGMLDILPTPIGAYKITVPTEKLGMVDTHKLTWDAHLTVTDLLGLLDTTPTKATFKQTINDILGLTDSATAAAAFKQAITDILGLLDTTSTKAAFHLAVSDVLGMLDSAARSRGFSITISEVLGLRDRLVTRKKIWPLRDLPDDTIQGGA